MEPINILDNFRKLFNLIISKLLIFFPSLVLVLGAILFIFLAIVFFLLTGTSL
ncbi:MAG: hypothetical protein Q8P72_03335 [Candidatus Roizmanbacteria bacterium]|nr:hypothetical protein [Candidatus Roizmanbacteria bacterium]